MMNNSVHINIAEIKLTTLNLERKDQRMADGNSRKRCKTTAKKAFNTPVADKNDEDSEDEGEQNKRKHLLQLSTLQPAGTWLYDRGHYPMILAFGGTKRCLDMPISFC